jgi:TPR repeat protein
MTKVSWKRILQRAGNDLPDHGRPFAESAPLPTGHRGGPQPIRNEPAQSSVAGELESELRRALQKAQDAAADVQPQPAYQPIYAEREMRHAPVVVPAPRQAKAQRRSGGMRNVVAISLSIAVVGFAYQQMSDMWRSGGGGGGGGEQQQSQSTSVRASIDSREQSKLVQTGYAIQPLLQPGNQIDLSPPDKSAPSLIGNDKPTPPGDAAAEAAAAFKRDMDEAVKMFETKQVPVSEAPIAVPPATESAPPVTAAPPPPAPKLASTQPKLSGEEEELLLRRATGLMKRGDITGARLLFEHLAYRGSALGAFALAQSYDERYLNQLTIRGLSADQKQADYWYQRASELGSSSR